MELQYCSCDGHGVVRRDDAFRNIDQRLPVIHPPDLLVSGANDMRYLDKACSYNMRRVKRLYVPDECPEWRRCILVSPLRISQKIDKIDIS